MAKKENSPEKIYRPKEVEYAIKLLLTSLVFGVLVAYINNSVSPDSEYFMVQYNIILLSLLFNGYFIFKITQNRNWARKIYIAFTLISVPIYISQLITLFTTTPFNGFLLLANILIQVIAVYFLLTKESKKWFMLVKSR